MGLVTTPLVVTGDQRLIQHIADVVDQTGVKVMRSLYPESIKRLWLEAPLILVGDDRIDLVADMPRRHSVVLLVVDMDDPTIWERGTRLGAERVLWLPDHTPWLAGRLTGLDARPRR